MADVVVILVLLALIIPAVCCIVRAKKKGRACIGCPDSGSCGGNCHCTDKNLK